MSPTLADRLAASPAVSVAARALADRQDAWLVGGAIRDAVLGADVVDVDIAVAGREREAAQAIASAAGGPSFPLSAEHGVWRALDPDRRWHVDVTRLRGERIEDDLGLRDFALNAAALPLAHLDSEPIDPTGGMADAEARVLRAASAHTFVDDPLRILRVARLASTVSLEIEANTVSLARAEAARAAEPAGERQLAELRLMITGPDPRRGLALMDEIEATRAVLPEIHALHGVEQNPYHHLDVYGHTLEVLGRTLELERDLASYVGGHAQAAGELLAAPLSGELTRGGALRFAALFHDIGKPDTRSVGEGGRVLFMGHDRAGVRMVREICARLRASRRLADYLANLTLNHLRLGFLVHEQPLSRRAIHEYLRATDPDGPDVTLLTVADRLATQGDRTKPEAIDAHLALARELLGESLAWRRDGPPAPPIRGDELAAALGIAPGPELGRLLAEIEAATFAGEVTDREAAIALARRGLEAKR